MLLHPALLIPVHRNGSHVYMSVTHALAGSVFGALPRASHYPGLAPEPLLPHLAKLASHPCLKLGLGRSWHVRFDVDKGAMRSRRETLVEHALSIRSPKIQSLGSVTELAALASQRSEEGLPIPLLDGLGEEQRKLVVATMAVSLFAASGVAPVLAHPRVLSWRLSTLSLSVFCESATNCRPGHLVPTASRKG